MNARFPKRHKARAPRGKLWLVSSFPPARLLARHRGTYDRYPAHPYHIRKFLLAAIPFWVWCHAGSALRFRWDWAVRGCVVVLRLEGLSCPDWFVEVLHSVQHGTYPGLNCRSFMKVGGSRQRLVAVASLTISCRGVAHLQKSAALAHGYDHKYRHFMYMFTITQSHHQIPSHLPVVFSTFNSLGHCWRLRLNSSPCTMAYRSAMLSSDV